jgi:hypothetical protein
MKRIALAVALVGCAGAAFAQKPTDVPPPNCGAKPEYPGRLVMTSDMRRRNFDREVAKYTECMKAYVADRKASSEAHMAAGNAAIDDYNATIKKIKDDEEAAKERSQ